MQKYSKISLITFFLVTVSIFLYSTFAVFIHDPLMVWHKPFFRKQLKYQKMRESARAFIRNYDFDSVIIGNSYSENTSSALAGKILNGKFFNLSIAGSTIFEKQIILKYLLQNKKIKQVIYISDLSYFDLKKEDKDYPVANYDFLYNNNDFDDYKIYLNYKYLPCCLMFSNSKKCAGSPVNIDKPYAWEMSKEHYERYGGFDIWLKHKDNNQLKQDFDRWLKLPFKISNKPLDEQYKKGLEEYLDNDFFSIIKAYPDVKFYFIVSPMSDIELSAMLRDDNLYYFKKYELFIKNIVLKSPDNLEIYAFDDTDYFTKIDNFKDARHYKTEINNYILESISKKQHKITSKNVDEYLNNVNQKSEKFDFEGHIKKIKDVF